MFFRDFYLLSLLFSSVVADSSLLFVPNLIVNYHTDIIDQSNPTFGWQVILLGEDNLIQSAYRILVASTQELLVSENPDLWDTGKVYSNESWNIRYHGKALKTGQRVFGAVKVWDQNDVPSNYGFGNWRREFTMAQWTAKWISPPKSLKDNAFINLQPEDEKVINTHPGIKPVVYYRKTFTNTDPVESAFIHCSAKGMFQGYLTEWLYSLHNGNVFPSLTPGWTNYNKTIQYHSFDVTSVLNNHVNHTLAFAVAPGWYSGYIAPDNYNVYGTEQSLLLELHIVYKNDTKRIITSDESWRVSTGPIVYSDLVHGEVFYEDRQLQNWIFFNYSDTNWLHPVTESINKDIKLLSDSITAPVGMSPSGLQIAFENRQIDKDVFVYNFNRILSGKIDIYFQNFTNNTRVQIRYGEAVYPNGSIYTGNHKSGLDTDVVLLNDAARRCDNFIFTPLFTYRSFKYVEVTGLTAPLELRQIHAHDYAQGILQSFLGADSLYLLNLHWSIGTSQYANSLSITTNTASKDTKIGWLEPVGLYSLSGMYMSGESSSFKKVLRDVRDAQEASGALPNVVPKAVDESDASPGSGTAPIIITYNIYKMFGDLDVVKENYDSNKKWLKYVRGSNPNYLFTRNAGNNVGDFANVNAETPKEVTATAYYAYGTLLMSYMAQVLNKTVDEEFYSQLHKNISNAFVKAYVNETDGKVNGDTQTGYVVALEFKLLPDEQIPKAVKHLVENIKAHDYHLTTGYIGTAFILPVLCDHGHTDVAYKLLLQDTYPSWKYMVDNGGWAIWERWDSWTEENGFNDPASFSSLGLATVGRFIYQYMGGINTDDKEVGFRKIIFKPHIGEGISFLNSVYHSNYGIVRCAWTVSGNVVDLQVNVPLNSNAKLILPFKKEKWEKELTSGSYQFSVTLDE